MLQRKPGDGLVVGLDPWNARHQSRSADIHGGDSHCRNDAGHAVGFDAGDDAVKLPVAGNGFIDLMPAMLGQMQRPAAGPCIIVDTAKDATGVAVGGLDNNGHVEFVDHPTSDRLRREAL
jgi:hypothetical protein